MRRSPLKRKAPLRSRGRKPEPTPPAWRVQPGERCACGEQATDGHHVIAKSVLKAYGHAHLIWDMRNRLPVCRSCHANTHAASSLRLTRDQLRPENVAFAFEVGLLWLLFRTYPERSNS